LQEEVLEKRGRIQGDDHPDALTTMHNLALTYWQQGKTVEVAALEEQVLEKSRHILGDDHPDTLTTMGNLASTYGDLGQTKDAAALQEKVLEAHSGWAVLDQAAAHGSLEVVKKLLSHQADRQKADERVSSRLNVNYPSGLFLYLITALSTLHKHTANSIDICASVK